MLMRFPYLRKKNEREPKVNSQASQTTYGNSDFQLLEVLKDALVFDREVEVSTVGRELLEIKCDDQRKFPKKQDGV